MEGSGSSSSQIVAQVGLTVEEPIEEVSHRSKLAVSLMNSPVSTLF
ncbi:MAG: hypothetical protein JOZ78_08325 [Chroococcidiopsidaceae cyanobacterium CP_BM_ER_R8_30]|nr:hypothetical protein [Chroococcidiopsidaceae cyanobacterium CP_BM_ER_R8_30]